MQGPLILRLGLVVASVAVAGPLAAAPHLQVHGAARFEARATHASGNIAVAGALVDDVDRPIGGALVHVRFAADDGAPLPVWTCGVDAPPLAGAPDGTAVLTTDPDGTFCARTTPRATVPGLTTASLSWPGDRLVAGAHTELSIDPSRAAVQLAFDPPPRTIALAEGPVVVHAAATVVSDEPSATSAGLALRLEDEHGAVLAEATTDATGIGRFAVAEARLGPPGPGELRLVFDGDARHAKAAQALSVERRVLVGVAPHTSDPRAGATAEETDDGAVIDLDVRSALGADVPGGASKG